MLSINSIARVIVNMTRSAASPNTFDTGLLLIKDTNYAAARRLEAVDSSAAAVSKLVSWGFGDSTEVYKAAVKYFVANPTPSPMIGRSALRTIRRPSR